MSLPVQVQSLLGIPLLLALAWLISENRRQVNWRRTAIGLGLQVAIALLFFHVSFLATALQSLNGLVTAVETATNAGASFLFGYLSGGPTPFDISNVGANFIVAFRVLPLVLVMSALSAVLFHWGVLQALVRVFSKALQSSLKINGPLGFGVAANVYLGIVEAPLFIKPYLRHMDRSSLFVVMSAGMATVAGTVMILYASLLNPILPGALGHILVASVISAPAVILIGQLMVPPTSSSASDGVESDASSLEQLPEVPRETQSALDALVKGTLDGMVLLLNIVAMILVLFALVNLVNQGLALLPWEGITVQSLLGTVLQPIAWLMGVQPSELSMAGELLGTKIALNEFVSYSQMAALPEGALSEKSRTILLYAMCGFANFASVGLIVGALGTLIPERRAEIVGLSWKSLIAGFLATCMTGALAGLLL